MPRFGIERIGRLRGAWFSWGPLWVDYYPPFETDPIVMFWRIGRSSVGYGRGRLWLHRRRH